MCVTVTTCVCVCVLIWMFPRGPSSRQASKLPGNGAEENSPQQEPGTTNQCQWTSLSLCIKPAQDDVMTQASAPWQVGGYTVFYSTLAQWRWGFLGIVGLHDLSRTPRTLKLRSASVKILCLTTMCLKRSTTILWMSWEQNQQFIQRRYMSYTN